MTRHRRSPLRAITPWGALLAAALGAPSAAASTTPAVAARDCGDLDVPEVERLLGIELATVRSLRGADRDALPEVEIACSADDARIVVRDALTSKALARTIRAPAAGALRAQIFAFAISELFLTSWLELVVAPRGFTARASDATDAAERRARAALNASSAHWEMGAEGVFRVRAPLGCGVHEQAVALRVGALLGDFRAFALAAGETARKRTALGDVLVTGARLGVGAGWRAIALGVFSLETQLTLSVLALRADGVAAAPAVTHRSASGVGAALSLGAGPAVRIGRVRVGASFLVDVRVPSFTGRVPGGAPVTLGGAALAGALWSSYDLEPF